VTSGDSPASATESTAPAGALIARPAWNVLTGTLTSYALLFVTIGLGIFLMPFTMSHLGKSEYGLWMLAASMTGYLQLLDLGYGSGLVRQITQADARQDDDDMNVVLSTFVVVYGAIGIVSLAVIALLALIVIPRFPNLSADDVRTAQWVIAIIGFRTALAFPLSVFGAVTTARQRFALTGRIAIVLTLLQGAATYIVLRAGYGLIPLVATTTAIALVGYVAYAAAARATFPAMRISVRRFSPQQVREVTSFSFYLFLISIAVYAGTSVDNLIIGAYLGTSAIAVYTVALRLTEYQRQLCGQFGGFLFPLVVRFDADRDVHSLRTTLIDGTRIAFGLACCVALGLLAFGRELIALWMGPGFAGSTLPLYVLALASIVMVAQGPAGTILLATGRHRLVAGASVLEIVLNVVFSIALVSGFGLTGVAIGTFLPYAILNLAVLMPIAARAVNVPLRQFAAAVLTPALVATAPAATAAFLFRQAASAPTFATVLGQLAVVGLVYLAAFLWLGLRRADRTRYVGSLKRVTMTVETTRAVAS
jgi:O-antigen/teichoic acid export membrane protein